jgi:hypothetical protein
MLIVRRDQEAKSMPKLVDVKEIIQEHSFGLNRQIISNFVYYQKISLPANLNCI